jgi:hypothetical protein
MSYVSQQDGFHRPPANRVLQPPKQHCRVADAASAKEATCPWQATGKAPVVCIGSPSGRGYLGRWRQADAKKLLARKDRGGRQAEHAWIHA